MNARIGLRRSESIKVSLVYVCTFVLCLCVCVGGGVGNSIFHWTEVRLMIFFSLCSVVLLKSYMTINSDYFEN